MKLNTVMLVDDNDADLLYTRIVLEHAGVCERVLSFGSGPEALEHLRRAGGAGIDAILLDINMPEMDGFEFLQAYETLPESARAGAVVVMLSASPNPRDRERALRFASVRKFVVKPIDLVQAEELLALLGPEVCS